jgi:hypothetical protein
VIVVMMFESFLLFAQKLTPFFEFVTFFVEEKRFDASFKIFGAKAVFSVKCKRKIKHKLVYKLKKHLFQQNPKIQSSKFYKIQNCCKKMVYFQSVCQNSAVGFIFFIAKSQKITFQLACLGTK